MDAVSRYRFVPPVPHRSFIPRTIADRISRSPYPLTVLASPSGFGKSTSMSQAFALAQAEGEAAHWLNLYYRPAGRDGLADYLALALADRAADDDRAMLGRRGAGIDDVLAAIDAACRRDRSLSLYLDEVAPDDLEMFVDLSSIVARHFGDRTKLVMSSRIAPPRLSSLFGDGATLLTPTDLCFSAAEIGQIFNGSLPERDVAALIATTGGWPSLIASLRHRMAGPSPAEAQEVMDGFEDLFLDFARDLIDLGPSSRDAEVLAAAFAFGNAMAPIFERDDFASAAAVVTRLAREGLVKLRSEGMRLTYEPHAAVRFAVDRLGRRSSRKRMLDIHRSISDASLENGDPVGAIRHVAETGDVDRLADLIEAGGGWLLILQWGAPIIQAVETLPIERLGLRPATLLAKAFVRMHLCEIVAARVLLDDIAARFQPEQFEDTTAFGTFRIGVHLIDAVLRSYEMRPIDFPALEDLRDRSPSATRAIADAVILNLKGGYQLRAGQVFAAEETGRAAALKCQAAKATFVEAYVQLWLGQAHLQTGKTRDAGRRFETVLAIAETCFGADSNHMIAAKIFLAELEFERGNVERAYAILDTVVDRIEQLDPWYEMLKPFYRITSNRMLQQQGPDRAISFLDGELDRMTNRPILPLSAYLKALRTEMLLLSEAAAPAVDGEGDELEDIEPIERAFLAIRVGLKRGDRATVESELDALLDRSDVRDCAPRLITGTVLKAACLRGRGEAAAAGVLTEQAARLAERSDLRGHLQREIAASQWTGGAAERPGARGSHDIDEPIVPRLGPREREVLGFIAEGLSSKEIAYRMSLSLGTVLGYRKNLYRKIGVNSRSAAISFARAASGSSAMIQ